MRHVIRQGSKDLHAAIVSDQGNGGDLVSGLGGDGLGLNLNADTLHPVAHHDDVGEVDRQLDVEVVQLEVYELLRVLGVCQDAGVLADHAAHDRILDVDGVVLVADGRNLNSRGRNWVQHIEAAAIDIDHRSLVVFEGLETVRPQLGELGHLFLGVAQLLRQDLRVLAEVLHPVADRQGGGDHGHLAEGLDRRQLVQVGGDVQTHPGNGGHLQEVLREEEGRAAVREGHEAAHQAAVALPVLIVE